MTANDLSVPNCPPYLHGFSKDPTKPNPMLKSLIDYAKSAGFQGLNLGKDWPLDAAAVAAIHQAGLKCLVWTVNEPAMAKKLAGHHYGHASRAACRT